MSGPQYLIWEQLRLCMVYAMQRGVLRILIHRTVQTVTLRGQEHVAAVIHPTLNKIGSTQICGIKMTPPLF